MIYDVIILGAGPSGLYLAQKLRQQFNHHLTILILEKNGYVGGRTRQIDFFGELINTGAGVGRVKKDHHLLSMQKRLDRDIHKWRSRIGYDGFLPVPMKRILRRLQKMYRRDVHRSLTFQQFFLLYYSIEEWKRFCWTNGYTDFVDADIEDTLFDYGFEDNLPGAEFFRVEWNKMMEKLAEGLDIRFHHESRVFRYHNKCYTVETMNGNRYRARVLVVAGFLHPSLPSFIHEQIRPQPFLRAYRHFKKAVQLHEPVIHNRSESQKQIQVTDHIIMTAYCDNDNARHYVKRHKNTDHSVVFYREIGTHYYRPLSVTMMMTRTEFIDKAQNPEPNLFVIGEMISQNQGWTEGAFDSVHRIYRKLCSVLSS